MSKLNLIPVAGSKNRVFVQPVIKQEKISYGGIIVPATAEETQKPRGVVLAVSEQDENGVKPNVKVGDVVIYSQYANQEDEHDGIKFLVMKEGDIFGKLKS